MAKLECHFFPDNPACWQCPRCQANYSEKCIPAGHSHHWGKRGPRCIRCETELHYLGNATDAKPFWQMLPHFFSYPLHRNSLTVIGLLALLSILMMGFIFSVILFLFGLSILVKYGLTIIECRGRGKVEPPNLSDVLGPDENSLFLRQMALMFLLMLAVYGAYTLNSSLGFVVSLFVTFAMPASIMLLAVDKSVRRALNPLAQISLMLAVGWPYLLLWLCIQIVSAGPMYLSELLLFLLPDVMVLPMLVAVSAYFAFVLYTMMGYVLFEYQQELGLAAAVEPQQMEVRDFEKAKALGEARVLIKDGDYMRARASLRKVLDLVHDDIELHLHYHKLLMLLDDNQALANHGEYFVELAARQGCLGKAVPVVVDVQKRVPDFRLKDMGLALELARHLQLQGQHRALVRLFHNLHKTHGQDPLLPEAYFLVASVLFDKLNDDVKAMALIEFLLKKNPQHQDRAQWLALRATLASLP